jgi:hypothetical protein
MTTELVLLVTAGAPMPVSGRGGTCSVVIVDERIFTIDCGRGAPSAFVEAGLDFTRLEAVFVTQPTKRLMTLDFRSGARKSEAKRRRVFFVAVRRINDPSPPSVVAALCRAASCVVRSGQFRTNGG